MIPPPAPSSAARQQVCRKTHGACVSELVAAEVEHLAGVPTVLSQFDRGDGSESHRHHALRPGPHETRHDGLRHAG
jgi:hypothetical protein